MSRNLYAIAFSFLFLTLGCRSIAEPDLRKSPERIGTRTLRIATSGDYTPFSEWAQTAVGADSEPSPRGFSIDVARAFAGSHNLEIEWVRFQWPTLIDQLEATQFDMAISGITVRPERSIKGLFSIPLTTSGAVVLVPESGPLHDISDLDRPSTRLAVNAGGHLERVTRRLFPQAAIEAIGRNSDVLGRLRSGDADGVVTDTLEAPHWQTRSIEPLRRIGALTTDRKAALFPSDASEFARQFDDWLLDAEADGELGRLRELHGLSPTRTAEPTTALLASLDERLALMTSVARAKATLEIQIEDLEVEARVLAAAWTSVDEAARARGVSSPSREAVKRLFRAQIEAAKWIQRNALRDAQLMKDSTQTHGFSHSAAARKAARANLEDALRPALIRIGGRIATLVARLTHSPRSSLDLRETQDALSSHGLPAAELQAVHLAVVNLLPSAARPASAPPQ